MNNQLVQNEAYVNQFLVPWVQEEFIRLKNPNDVIKCEKYLQLLKINDIPSSQENNFAIILVHDTQVQLYAKINAENLPVDDAPFYHLFRQRENSCLKINSFSFIIKNINDRYYAPILHIHNFSVLNFDCVLVGKPIWVQEKSQINTHLNLLDLSDKIKYSLHLFKKSMPSDIFIPDYCTQNKNININDEIYMNFKNFSICYDQLLLSKFFNQKIHKDINENLSKNNNENILLQIDGLNTQEIIEINEQTAILKTTPLASSGSLSDQLAEDYLNLDKDVMTFLASKFINKKSDEQVFNQLIKSLSTINKK